MNQIPQPSTAASMSQIGEALKVLFNCLPFQRGTDAETAILAYSEALRGSSMEAIQAGVSKFLRGECEGVSTRYVPTPPELARIVRSAAVPNRIPAERQLPKPPEKRGPSPFEVRRERELAKFAGWRVFKENVSYEEFRALSQRREIPVGATWCAFLATIYVPPVE